MDGGLLAHVQDVQAQRQAAFWRAVEVLRCDLRQSRLLERMADRADSSGLVEITVEEMAADRAWLPGSRAKAYAVVRWALQLELVTQERAVVVEGEDRRAVVRWRLRWDRIEEIAACPVREDARPPRGLQSTTWTPVHGVDSSPPCGLQSTTWTGPPYPGGETPRTRATGSTGTTDLPTTTTVVSVGTEARETVAPAEPAQIAVAALDEVCPQLWKGRPQEREGITATNDQRLTYQLAVLVCDPAHRPWVLRMLDAARCEGRKPAAFVLHSIEEFFPGGRRLLRSIHVPRWAHADPRQWCPNGEHVQRE